MNQKTLTPCLIAVAGMLVGIYASVNLLLPAVVVTAFATVVLTISSVRSLNSRPRPATVNVVGIVAVAVALYSVGLAVAVPIAVVAAVASWLISRANLADVERYRRIGNQSDYSF
jgi:uncharacterized membrane protein